MKQTIVYFVFYEPRTTEKKQQQILQNLLKKWTYK